MRPIIRLVLAAALLSVLGVRAGAVPPPSQGPKTDRVTMLASMKNFGLLLDASQSSLKEIPGSKYPTHDYPWYRAELAKLSGDVAANENPDRAAIVAFFARYDKLKQNFVDQMYDACPDCYNRDRRKAVIALQAREDAAIVIDRAENKPGVTDAQRERLDRLAKRLDGVDPNSVWGVKKDLGITRAPMTVVETSDGSRSFRDRLRYSPRLPTAGRPNAVTEPPPPAEGEWRPNQWVSRANWNDYKQLVPWLQTVLEKTGTAKLMADAGIKPYEFALSLISSESNFYHAARSPAKAYGYMQVLVGTAKTVLAGSMQNYRDVMRADREAYARLDPSQRNPGNAPQTELSARQLTAQNLRSDWKTNVFIGVTYLKQHVLEFKEKLAASGYTDPAKTGPLLQNIIAAAYNAGEGAVDKYWNRRLDIAAADPTKSIVPYKETKNYVRSIYERTDAATVPESPTPRL